MPTVERAATEMVPQTGKRNPDRVASRPGREVGDGVRRDIRNGIPEGKGVGTGAAGQRVVSGQSIKHLACRGSDEHVRSTGTDESLWVPEGVANVLPDQRALADILQRCSKLERCGTVEAVEIDFETRVGARLRQACMTTVERVGSAVVAQTVERDRDGVAIHSSREVGDRVGRGVASRIPDVEGVGSGSTRQRVVAGQPSEHFACRRADE